jgi:hypothetical protein
MRYLGLDLAAGLPAARSNSSSAFAYGRSAHLAAVSGEAVKAGPTTAAPRRCARTEYLHGFSVREELRRRGLLNRPEHLRGRRRAAA